MFIHTAVGPYARQLNFLKQKWQSLNTTCYMNSEHYLLSLKPNVKLLFMHTEAHSWMCWIYYTFHCHWAPAPPHSEGAKTGHKICFSFRVALTRWNVKHVVAENLHLSPLLIAIYHCYYINHHQNIWIIFVTVLSIIIS